MLTLHVCAALTMQRYRACPHTRLAISLVIAALASCLTLLVCAVCQTYAKGKAEEIMGGEAPYLHAAAAAACLWAAPLRASWVQRPWRT